MCFTGTSSFQTTGGVQVNNKKIADNPYCKGASYLTTVCHTEVIQQLPVLPGPVMTAGLPATGYRGLPATEQRIACYREIRSHHYW